MAGGELAWWEPVFVCSTAPLVLMRPFPYPDGWVAVHVPREQQSGQPRQSVLTPTPLADRTDRLFLREGFLEALDLSDEASPRNDRVIPAPAVSLSNSLFTCG